jgi:hypothetical protein
VFVVRSKSLEESVALLLIQAPVISHLSFRMGSAVSVRDSLV